MGCCMSSPSSDSPPDNNNQPIQQRDRNGVPASIADSQGSSPRSRHPQGTASASAIGLDNTAIQRSTSYNSANPSPLPTPQIQQQQQSYHSGPPHAQPLHATNSRRPLPQHARPHHHQQRHQQHHSTLPPAPLQPPRPWRSTSRTWTAATLSRERTAFFDTRVSGHAEVWAAIRLAVESMRDTSPELYNTDTNGDDGDGVSPGGLGFTLSHRLTEGGDSGITGQAFGEDAMATARSVLEAAGVSCPGGRMEGGVWDERGVWYEVPRWVVRDPVNMIEEDEDETGEKGAGDDEDVSESDEGDDVDGVAVAEHEQIPKEMIKVRARLSDRASDVIITVEKDASVRTVVRRVREAAKIPTNTKIKIAYLGKVLKSDESLTAQGWQERHVINALVFLRPWDVDNEKEAATATSPISP